MFKQLKGQFNKAEWSWMFQDWANSAYSLMITTAIFPIFYKSVADAGGISGADSTAYLGYTNAIATVLTAVLAPFLGTSADYKGYRKPLFTISTLLGIIAVFSMMFIGNGNCFLLLVVYAISSFGFHVANIFYDSSIMDVTTPERLDQVSSTGFGLGYIGSVFPFLIFMVFQLTGIFPANVTVNIGFLLTAAWWFIFTIPYWKNVNQVNYLEKTEGIIQTTVKSLTATVKELKKYPHIYLFLFGYFFYIDGVGTIIAMATSVGTDLGLSANELIIMLLVVQIVAFPCSIMYGYLARRFGTRTMLFVGIATYIVICIFGLSLDSFTDFMILAVLVGTAQGGIQGLSRSYFGQIIPREKSNQFYGFYNIFGKFSSVLGTTILGVVAQITGDSLKGLFALIVQFSIGAILLYMAKPSKSYTN
ncbi:MFS transporter [Aerococcaceae bacterium INB8]|uniref:MFS transporter n=1 Tax=Ruoffia halotolerans TaxID=2748684 RepID=A0A839A5A6_9LACT|nr:MFS transporter [Ruoffia halotolerans]MBA5729379.1 MFS transporter [Ruoffia halotolerans]